jgi:chromosome segregation ATPase
VKGNSSQAQFIMVSLRKVTLKEADHVYGVTMTGDQQTEIVGEVRVDEIVEEPPPELPAELAKQA